MSTRGEGGLDHKPSIRVLALDGGGVRGLSSLLILRELTTRIALRKGEPVRPCDCFELIIGTGTGGISALFLGRMRMTIDQAIEEYIRVAERAFEPRSRRASWLNAPQTALLDGSVLEKAIGDVVERVLGDQDASLASSPGEPYHCRTAVLAATRDSVDAPPHIFRSCSNGTHPASTSTIREVARATSSTAGLFESVSLGNPPTAFVDAGAAGYNNPTEIGFREIEQLWPGRQIDCFVSLGTGLQKIVSLSNDTSRIVEACRDIINSCEQVHDRVLHSLQNEAPYFRFNVDRGLDEVDIMEWNKTGPRGRLTGITGAYMRWKDVDNRLNACVRTMSGEKIGISHVSIIPDTSNNAQNDARKFLPILNPPPEIFYGRRNEVELAVTHIQNENPTHIAILGAGGIGKTSIALELLHDARTEEKFMANRRFIACEGISSTSSLVDTISTAFGLRASSADRRGDLIIFLKGICGMSPVLIVLDNFETVWDIPDAQTEAEEFLRDLGGLKLLSLVLTMRGAEHPLGIRWKFTLHVGQLDSVAARSTFRDVRGGDHTDDDQLDALLDAVDGVPLAVTLMARLGQNESPARLLERWATEQTRLLSRPRDRHRLKSVDISIDMSIKSHRMQSTPGALFLLSVICTLPSGVFDGDLPQICPSIENMQEASATLREVALAYYDAERTLRVLSPIRLYVLKYHAANRTLLKDVQSFHFKMAEKGNCSPGEPGFGEVVTVLPRYGDNIEAIIAGALTRAVETGRDKHDQAVEAALDWTQFLYCTYPRTYIIELALRFVQKQRRHRRLATCLRRLGNIQFRLWDYDAAQRNLTTALETAKVSNDRIEIAWCLFALGELQGNKGDHEALLDTMAAARQAFEELGYQVQVAWCLYYLGDTQAIMAEYSTARDTLTEAIRAFKAVNDQCGRAACLLSWANIQRWMDNFEVARETLTEARLAFEALHDRRGVAGCLRALGELQRETGEYVAARETFSTAQHAYEALNDRTAAAWRLLDLATIQRRISTFAATREALAEAQHAFEAVNDQYGVGKCLSFLDNFQRETSQYEAARDSLTTARLAFEAVDNREEVAECDRALERLHT